MNISWGFKITVLYLGFVGLIGVLVFKSMSQKVDLVSTDYYAQELDFQNHIDAEKNAQTLTHTIQHEVNGKSVHFIFPEEMVQHNFKGEVLFFRPSDSAKDLKAALMPSVDNQQIFTSDKFEHGIYKMQLNWSSGGKKYFKEDVIFIN